MKKKTIALLVSVIILIAGCGATDNPTITYRNNMDTFFKEVSEINDSINSIDTSKEGFEDELITQLYNLDTKISEMSGFEVPEEFPYVQQLSMNASSNMDKAMTYYRESLNGEVYNKESANIAYEYYSEANKNLHYIIRILHGEAYEDIIKNEENKDSKPSNEFETTSSSGEDDYSMYYEEDDNDYTVYNDPEYQEDIDGQTTDN